MYIIGSWGSISGHSAICVVHDVTCETSTQMLPVEEVGRRPIVRSKSPVNKESRRAEADRATCASAAPSLPEIIIKMQQHPPLCHLREKHVWW